jgi:ribonuclease III
VGVERKPAGEGASSGSLEELLGLPFSQSGLWDVALTHRSYAFEQGLSETNERLEFLGDAVLGVVITDLAFRRFPDHSEGELAKLRAATVKMSTLADVARELRLGALVRLGKGEEMSGGRDKASILADGMEAVIGAVYLDKGLDFARAMIERLFWPRMDAYSRGGGDRDFKMALQEQASRDLGVAPEYRVWSQGPDHAKEFTATVFLKGEEYGAGTGRSKKEAEQQAARQALEVLASRSGSEE